MNIMGNLTFRPIIRELRPRRKRRLLNWTPPTKIINIIGYLRFGSNNGAAINYQDTLKTLPLTSGPSFISAIF